MQELDRLSPDANKQAPKLPVIVLLDNVRSMHNVGSVFRTADCFNVKEIILAGMTPQPPHRDIQKTALGATETVAWRHEVNPIHAVETLKGHGYTIAAVEQVHESSLLHNIDFSGIQHLVLLFGNEVDGVSDELLKFADMAIEIPQFGSKHSLNISVSVGVVMWEIASQFIRR